VRRTIPSCLTRPNQLGLSVRTGHVDRRTTSSVTLPRRARFLPVRPCVAITTRSALNSTSASTTAFAGCPMRTTIWCDIFGSSHLRAIARRLSRATCCNSVFSCVRSLGTIDSRYMTALFCLASSRANSMAGIEIRSKSIGHRILRSFTFICHTHCHRLPR